MPASLTQQRYEGALAQRSMQQQQKQSGWHEQPDNMKIAATVHWATELAAQESEDSASIEGSVGDIENADG